MSAQDTLRTKLDELSPRGEVYVTVDDGNICVDGTMKLVEFQKLAVILAEYFEESKACPF